MWDEKERGGTETGCLQCSETLSEFWWGSARKLRAEESGKPRHKGENAAALSGADTTAKAEAPRQPVLCFREQRAGATAADG